MLARAATAASAVARSAVRAPAGPAMRMWGGRAASTEAAPKKKSRVLPKDEQSFVRRMFYGDVVGKQVRGGEVQCRSIRNARGGACHPSVREIRSARSRKL